MGFFDKLAFWKRSAAEEPLTFDNLPPLPGEQPGQRGTQQGFAQDLYGGQQGFGADTGLGGQGYGGMDTSTFKSMPAFKPVEPEPSFTSPRQFANLQQQPFQAQMPSPDIIASKNMEIISSKIDALSAQLESMSQRLRNIERVALEEEKKGYEKRW